MAGYRVCERPVTIPVPDGKLIEEMFGRVSTGTDVWSLAHMVAPPGWGEPAQTPEFGEITVMVRGKMQVEVGAEKVVLRSGQAIFVEPSTTVRYSNPFDEESEYFAICIPAFTVERAHRA
ncbi:MAG: cupin domain-containing protein [Actinobacteria bacterium]|nr:cupin domain-containing protein [Actinomycetota bacterium]